MSHEIPMPPTPAGWPGDNSLSESGERPDLDQRGGVSPVPKALEAHPLRVRSIDGKPCVFVAELGDREVGRMSITVVPLVHDMEIQPGPIQRKVADALFFYASGKVKAAGFEEALVLVADENLQMQGYVENRAIPEESSRVYLMGVQ